MDPPTFSSIDVNSLINNDNVSSESSPVKRKRLTQACDACRKKKVKCSGEKPSCNNCSRLGTHCTYLPSTRKRGPRVGLVESLEKRLQQMEKLLQPLKEQKHTDDIDDKQQSGYPTKKPRLNSKDPEDVLDIAFSRFIPPNLQNQNQFQQSSNKQNRSSSYAQNDHSQLRDQVPKSMEQLINKDDNKEKQITGKEDDELIYFGKTSVRPGFRHQSELCGGNATPNSPTISEDSSSSANSDEITTIVPTIVPTPRPIVVSDYLPIDVVEHLASCFFRYVDIQMSMFHEGTFMKQLRQNKVSALLVYAMCASSARYATHPSVVRDPPYMSGEPFANAANKMLLQSFDFPSVEHVQAYILLALHMFGTCKGPRSWMYIGMAVRMAQEIGLHKIDEIPLGAQPTKVKSEAVFIQKETRRRTFWSCFLLDRYSACAVGRPTLIEEDDCDVRLPCNEAIWNYDHPFSKALIEKHFNEHQVKHDSRIALAHEGLCACFVSVVALLGRVTQFVNRSKPSNSPPPWDPQSQFTILSKELEMWYNKLIPHYAYGKERLQKLMVNGTGVMFATFHILYYATVIVLNRPNIAILQNNEISEPHIEFMRASAKRCSEAARTVVSISSDILQHGIQCLCPYTVYPIFVSTTVLINDTNSSDHTVAEEAKGCLEMVEKYLKTMRPYWAMAEKFLRMINEMRKTRENEGGNDDPTNTFRSERRNSEQMGECSDAGLLAYWNRTNPVGNVGNGSNLDDITSIILPEEFSSPRWLGSAFNDSSMANDNSWTNFLRSPALTPRSISRLVKKDKNSNEEDSNDNNDYFSQDVTYNYPPPVFDGYPGMFDMSLLNNQNNFDWGLKDMINARGPSRHWSSITSMNEESSENDTQSMPTSNTNISA